MPEQNIMEEGPGLRQRGRETNAVMDSAAPRVVPEAPSKPAPIGRVKPGAKYGDRPKEKRIDTSEMTKPLGSFKHGTDYVPETGHYKLHEGEAVTTAKDNPMKDMYSKIHEGDEKPKKALKRISTHKSHDGKYIHTHEHHHPAHHPDETHVSNDMAELHDHMEKHAGAPNAGEQPAGGEQMAQLSATPPPAAPPAGGMPGAGA